MYAFWSCLSTILQIQILLIPFAALTGGIVSLFILFKIKSKKYKTSNLEFTSLGIFFVLSWVTVIGIIVLKLFDITEGPLFQIIYWLPFICIPFLAIGLLIEIIVFWIKNRQILTKKQEMVLVILFLILLYFVGLIIVSVLQSILQTNLDKQGFDLRLN